MLLTKILETLDAHAVYISDPAIYDKTFEFVSVTDLMSDALAMVVQEGEHTFLLTGLVNCQSLRTAEMLDIGTVIYVRNKAPQNEDLSTAQELNMNLFSTAYSMYEACGRLYELGIKTATK